MSKLFETNTKGSDDILIKAEGDRLSFTVVREEYWQRWVATSFAINHVEARELTRSLLAAGFGE